MSIGFTADSFIVYFERIRDELRDGKSITCAVEDGWGRAKRTIYISKSINILAAVVLYILADATVKGFAFTLGLTTVIDVLIFILFTHPVMQLLARTRFFGSAATPLSGHGPGRPSAPSTAAAPSSARPVSSGHAAARPHGEVARRGGATADHRRAQAGGARRRRHRPAEKKPGKTAKEGDD